MKSTLLILGLLAVVFCGYWLFFNQKTASPGSSKTGPLVSRKHSATFNAGLDSLLDAYFDIKDAFVNADSNMAKLSVAKLLRFTDSSGLFELKKDPSGIYESAVMQMSDIKTNADNLQGQRTMAKMKEDFNMIGESIYPLLKTIHYDGKTLYWQNCPMAFGEDKGANWISNTKEIINPYLGKKHPEFKATMLHCGEVKDSIKAQ